MKLLTRRQILTSIAQIAAASSLTACGLGSEDDSISDEAVVNNSDTEILASVAYDLFPHSALSAEYYVQIANAVLALNSALVSDGLSGLRNSTNGQPWLELENEERINILSALQGTEFFALMRSNTIAGLYKNPELFEFTGYGGSAIEKGGYINRGFDDISWLPEQESVQ